MWAAFGAQIQYLDHLKTSLVQSQQKLTVSISYQLRCDKINPEFRGRFGGELKLNINTVARLKNFRAFAWHKNGICWKSGLTCLIVGVWSWLTGPDGPSCQILASQLIYLHNRAIPFTCTQSWVCLRVFCFVAASCAGILIIILLAQHMLHSHMYYIPTGRWSWSH